MGPARLDTVHICGVRESMNRQQRRAADRARGKKPRTGPSPHPPTVLDEARVHLQAQRWKAAERAAREAVERDVEGSTARAVLAKALSRQGRLDEAMLEGRRATHQHPNDPLAHEAVAFLLVEQDRIPESITAFEKALELAPDRWSPHVGLGNSLAVLGALGEAHGHLQRAVDLAPDQAAAHSDLGQTLFRMGAYAEALDAYEQARALSAPVSALVDWNRSLALLGSGQLHEGWEAYEAGFASGARTPNRPLDLPRWEGEDLADQTILVWGEQGLGDEVRFASCFDDLIDRAGHVVIEASARLVPLFRRSFPEATVRAETYDRTNRRETASFEGVDLHSPAGSLPRHLRPTLASFPQEGAFLEPDPRQREQFRDRLAALPPGLRVGVCWRSMNLATKRLSHYTTLAEWEPVFAVPGTTFVNLQYGSVALREQELREAEGNFDVTIHRWDDLDYTRDLEAVAGLTAGLDLVIGPNTFATLLAGALGVPTLVVGLPSIWQHGQDTEPWAPTTSHLVRQWDEPWGPVMERAAAQVQSKIDHTP